MSTNDTSYDDLNGLAVEIVAFREDAEITHTIDTETLDILIEHFRSFVDDGNNIAKDVVEKYLHRAMYDIHQATSDYKRDHPLPERKSVELKPNSDPVPTPPKDVYVYTPPTDVTFENCPEIPPPKDRVTKLLTDLDVDTLQIAFSYMDRTTLLNTSAACTYFRDQSSLDFVWRSVLTNNHPAIVFRNNALETGETEENKNASLWKEWKYMLKFKQFFDAPTEMSSDQASLLYMRTERRKNTTIKSALSQMNRGVRKERAINAINTSDCSMKRSKYEEYSTIFKVMWAVYGVAMFFVFICFSILFPLCLDKTIPRKKYIWLVPYLPFAVPLVGGFLFNYVIQVYLSRSGPILTRTMIDDVYHIFVKRSRNVNSGACIEVILSSLFLHVPLLAVLLGIRIGLDLVNFRSIYIIIPVVVVQWLPIIPVILQMIVFFEGDHLEYIIPSSIGYILTSASYSAALILTALKVDGTLPAKFHYSTVFIFYYLTMLLFSLTCYSNAVSAIMKDTRGKGWCYLVWPTIFLVLCIVFIWGPIFTTILLSGFNLDKVFAIPYIAAFSPLFALEVLVFVVSLIATLIAVFCIPWFGGS